MLINVKMPTNVGSLTLLSKLTLCSAELSMKKVFISSGPDPYCVQLFQYILERMERIHLSVAEIRCADKLFRSKIETFKCACVTLKIRPRLP